MRPTELSDLAKNGVVSHSDQVHLAKSVQKRVFSLVEPSRALYDRQETTARARFWTKFFIHSHVYVYINSCRNEKQF